MRMHRVPMHVAVHMIFRWWICRHWTSGIDWILERVLLTIPSSDDTDRPRRGILVVLGTRRSWRARGTASTGVVQVGLKAAIAWRCMTGMGMLLNIAVRVGQIPAIMRHIVNGRKGRGL